MKKYSGRVDLLNVLLTDDTEYTFAEVDKIMDKFLKSEVK